MTIVYVLPDKNAGVASVVRNLLQFKTSRFLTKVILLHDVNDPNDRRINTRLNADQVIRLEFNQKWSRKYTILKKIRKELDRQSILVSNDGSVELDVVGFYGLKIPVVYIMHGDYDHYYNVVKYKRHYISQVITVSNFIKSKLESKFRDILINSIKFPVPNVVSSLKEPTVKIRIVFVGSLTKVKGVYEFIKIIKGLELAKVDYTFNIIGDGPESKNLVNELAVYERVRFLGHMPNAEVLAKHKEHDIIILPSKNEGLPVVIVEAMKCGVVPIVSDIKSGIPELVHHGENGYRVGFDEIDKYSFYISSLNSDRDTLEEMRSLCIEKANRLFDPIIQTKAYEDAMFKSKTNYNKMVFRQKLHFYIPTSILRILKK